MENIDVVKAIIDANRRDENSVARRERVTAIIAEIMKAQNEIGEKEAKMAKERDNKAKTI